MNRTILKGLATGAVLAGLAAQPAMAIEWDMPNEYNATSIHALGDKYFADALSQKTDGEITITHHFGGSLGYKSVDQFDAVADGAVPIADTFVGPLSGIDPMFLLSSLPFVASSIDEAKLLWEVARPYYEKIFEENNQKLLYASPWPPSGIWSKTPVIAPGDVKTLKIRTYDANGTITFRDVGAAPIQLSWADVVPQLNTGGIGAVLTSADGGAAASLWEYLSDFSEVNYASPLNMTHMNLDVFNALTPEQQEAVLEAAEETTEHQWQLVRERRVGNYDTMRENGMNVHVDDVSPELLEVLATAGEAAIADWLEKTGETGQKILDEFAEQAGK
ncbi:TRAP transporter substrate-binding protein [Kaustia mangrovi]|uniref:TRAP transporter substrate-binding protein n=1 Tax=Kaustia mangrovi TaxID=2593653 RepID=A0A7S8HCA9_9HYPH|nr:TRAP transporter substrate-binding protein [Kaustia mangrovi]QPC43274.1 TRAP transporter substrate-binding protein [Kaustia mangrovi]